LDSVAALATLWNQAEGGTPRSHIEVRLKDALQGAREVGVVWVRAHIGILGNETADQEVSIQGTIDVTRGDPEVTTFEVMWEKGREWSRTLRNTSGFEKCRTEWGKHVIAAYTWTRTNHGT